MGNLTLKNRTKNSLYKDSASLILIQNIFLLLNNQCLFTCFPKTGQKYLTLNIAIAVDTKSRAVILLLQLVRQM